MVVILGIPYAEYIGSGIALAIVIFLGWILLRNKGGRLGEEQEEEVETEKLEQDEKVAEKAQKDEKKQCVKMSEVIDGILETLRKGGMGDIYDKVLSKASSAKIMLWRMRDEKMRVERAIDTFKTLHASLNELIANLPTDNKNIKNLNEQLVYYQKRYYKDL